MLLPYSALIQDRPKLSRDWYMHRFIRRYLQDTSGAVTVDWVVMTAIVVSLGVAAASNISAGVQTSSVKVQEFMEEQELLPQGD